MKLLLLTSLLVAVSRINGHVNIAKIHKNKNPTELAQILELTQKVNQYVAECIENPVVGDSKMKKHAIEELTKGDDESFDAITRCFFLKAGILGPNGQLNADAALSMLTLMGIDEDSARSLLKQCTSIAGYDAHDTAYAIYKCFDNAIKND